MLFCTTHHHHACQPPSTNRRWSIYWIDINLSGIFAGVCPVCSQPPPGFNARLRAWRLCFRELHISTVSTIY